MVAAMPSAIAATPAEWRGGGPALLPEDLQRLRQAHHARQRRDLRAGEARRIALAVPVLVELTDRGRGVLVEVDAARDLGAALAAHLLEPAHAVVAERDDRTKVSSASAQRPLGSHRTPDIPQRLRGAPRVDSRYSRLTAWSSVPNVSAVTAEFVEEPASLSSSA
jgi:hypothetical protein